MTIREIGLLQGRRLANMSYSERLAFIAEGLPIIVASSRELMDAAKSCANERAKGILERHAAEEAVKALILLDVARCGARPRNRILTRARVGAPARLSWRGLRADRR